MSLTTRFGNLANILDRESRQQGVMVLDSPVLTNKEWTLLQSHFGEIQTEIDCTYAVGHDAVRHAVARGGQQTEQAVRDGRMEIFVINEKIRTKARQLVQDVDRKVRTRESR